MEWARITINTEPQIKDAAEARAKARRQSVSAYISTLIEADAEAARIEDKAQAPYVTNPENQQRSLVPDEVLKVAQAEAAKIPPPGLPDPQESQPAAKGKRARKSRKRGGTK